MIKMLQRLFLICIMHKVYATPLNAPYHSFKDDNKVGLQSLITIPAEFDPIRAYDAESIYLLNQIYEPLYTFAYLKKPYQVVPHIAEKLPKIEYFNQAHQQIYNENLEEVAFTVYTIPIKHGIFYQPHPGFCNEHQGFDCQLYRRELSADDYEYQMKRIAQSYSHSPMTSILRRYIVGFKEYMDAVKDEPVGWRDFSDEHIEGVKVVDPYTLQMVIKGHFAQWLYWLTMGFMTPMPWEIDWYQQMHPEINQWKNYSVGTGPYMFYQNDSFKTMILKRNPNYREDIQFIHGQRRQLPIIDKFIFTIEKEAIPKWNKFLQGYYDTSFIPSESFENSMQFNRHGKIELANNLQRKGLKLQTEMANSTSGIGFNMRDHLVGGYDEKSKKLRRAIAMAFDFNEYLSIFRNGRGVLAHGPIPPNIEGYVSEKDSPPRSLKLAKQLLAEAGYPKGINPVTHRHLVIHFDVVSRGLPEEKAVLSWFRKQALKIGVYLNIREYDKNRYDRKLNSGDLQMFYYAWIADYPDPENFLMLFYGPNQKAKRGGENLSNFVYRPYDRLFHQLQFTNPGPDRLQVISKMNKILQEQGVWGWAIHGENFYISQSWLSNADFSAFTVGNLKYMDVDGFLREKKWDSWNKAKCLPFIVIMILLILVILPFYRENLKINRAKARRTSF